MVQLAKRRSIMDTSSHDMLWATYVGAAEELEREGLFGEAEHVLQNALNDARELGEVDRRLINSLHSLAERYYKRGRYERAEELYRQVLSLRASVLGASHEDIADSIERLAGLLRHTRRDMEASTIELQARTFENRFYSA